MSIGIRDDELNGEYHHDCNVLITRAAGLRANYLDEVAKRAELAAKFFKRGQDNKLLREVVDLFLQTAHQWVGSEGMEALEDAPPYQELIAMLKAAEGE